MKTKIILTVIAIFLVGALGALVFDVFVLPYLLTNSYFERFQFVKDFKSGKIIINPKEQVYIQENIALETAIEKVTKSVAIIQGTTLSGNSYLGSGLIATSDGLVVTLSGLTPKGAKFNIFINGKAVNFTVQKVDLKNNLTLIKVDESGLPTVGFMDYDKIKLGQRVFLTSAFSVKAGDWLANEGIVRSFNPNNTKTTISEKSVVNGSPLFNISGELVGLSYVDQENKISAISVSVIKDFLGL